MAFKTLVFLLISVLPYELFAAAPLACAVQTGGFDHKQVYENFHFRVVKLLPGQYGGNRVVVERKDSVGPWKMVNPDKESAAIPGNVFHYFKFLDRKTREFFGITALDKNFKEIHYPFHNVEPAYVVFPDFYEITGGLKVLDGVLTSHKYFGIPMGMYLTPKILDDEQAVRNYDNRIGLPYSIDSVISYHDFNYHFITILMFNEKMIKASMQMTEVFVRFADWLKETHPKLGTRKVLETLFHIRSHQQDLSGNFTMILANPDSELARKSSMTALKVFTGAGDSAFGFLVRIIEFAKTTNDWKLLEVIPKEIFEEFKITLSPEFFEEHPEMKKLKDGGSDAILRSFKMRLNDFQMALQGVQNPH